MGPVEHLYGIAGRVVEEDECLDISPRGLLCGPLYDVVPDTPESRRHLLEVSRSFDLPTDRSEVVRRPVLDEKALMVAIHSQGKTGVFSLIDHLKPKDLRAEILPRAEVAHFEDQVP